MLESELASPTPLLLQQHYRKSKILFTQSLDEANGLIAKQLQCVCHDTLPWLISFSLGIVVCHEKD
jgi:hypothetical protein